MEKRWKVRFLPEVWDWYQELDPKSHGQVTSAIETLRDEGPLLKRPLADRIQGSTLRNLKELRPGSAGVSELRILFVFDPWRCAILLVAGDKAGNWSGWYKESIPLAEKRYAWYLEEQEAAEVDQ